uniref:LamG-like jellyroll fold domain-containing protein n=1 Tax=viral metagenome TaxID=1070528 RepID=A0A6C0FB91_9ZZZZ|tara:strand:+ start:35539 stop:36738 length:1200 start_codon:yes stop_codon:yes gene_type:complete
MSDIMNDLQSEKSIPLYSNIVFFLILSMLFIQENKKKDEKDPYRKEWKDNTRYGIIILSILLVCLYLYAHIAKNALLLTHEYQYHITLGVLSLLYIGLYISQYEAIAYSMYILTIFIVIVAMALLFNVFINFFKSLKGIAGVVANLIFFIPCLFSDFVSYIMNEYKTTPNKILTLFGLEIILLLIYLYLPDLLYKLSVKDGVEVLKNYVYLNEENIIPLEDNILAKSSHIKTFSQDQQEVTREYSFSMWIFLNQHSTSMSSYNKETNIFDFGNGKPRVTYYNNENDSKNKDVYRIYFSNQEHDKQFYDIQLPSQKWNHIVFNYKSRHVDLFVNGKLLRTFTFKNKIPSYNLGDLVTIGSENGLSGSIANVRYYQKNLSKQQINNIYNILMNKNPPVNNL